MEKVDCENPKKEAFVWFCPFCNALTCYTYMDFTRQYRRGKCPDCLAWLPPTLELSQYGVPYEQLHVQVIFYPSGNLKCITVDVKDDLINESI